MAPLATGGGQTGGHRPHKNKIHGTEWISFLFLFLSAGAIAASSSVRQKSINQIKTTHKAIRETIKANTISHNHLGLPVYKAIVCNLSST